MRRHGFAAEHAAARAEIAARAEVKRLAHSVRDRSDENDPATRAWLDAIERWDRAVSHVYPADFRNAFEDLRQRRLPDATSDASRWTPAQARSIEIAIRFLEADVICFRSGYVKERLIRRLIRQSLTSANETRLRAVVLDVLDRRGGRDFRAYCRLAARVADAELTAAIVSRTTGQDADLHRRAAWMRGAIATASRRGGGSDGIDRTTQNCLLPDKIGS